MQLRLPDGHSVEIAEAQRRPHPGDTVKPVSASDLRHLADQLERTARVIRGRGDEAVRRSRDWATPLRSSGTDPGRGKGSVSDPTATAATMEHPDPNAEQLVLLSSEAGRAFDAVVTLESRVLRIATDAVIENQRAGIGYCETCNRYMDGTANKRLRNGLCPACDVKARRERDKPQECRHHSVLWHRGESTCNHCGKVLDPAASRPA